MVSKVSPKSRLGQSVVSEPVMALAPSAGEIRKRFVALEASLAGPPLLDDESVEGFNLLFDQFLENAVPNDAIEYMYVRDAAILTFEIVRLRKHKLFLLQAAQPEAVKILISYNYTDASDAKAVAKNWAIGNPTSEIEVEAVLSKRKLPQSAIYAKALELKLDQIQKIEAMILTHEARRFTFFREIERKQDHFKRRLQEAIQNVDGSYSLAGSDTSEIEAAKIKKNQLSSRVNRIG